MVAAIQFPSWLSPEIIPGLPFRWYGLMYVIAFGVTWLLFTREARRRAVSWTEDDSASFFFWAIAGLLLGARIFGTFLYDPTHYYLQRPWLVFWPFDEAHRFVGFQGMSYHGGLIGAIVATLVFSKVRKLPWLAFADIMAISAPLGYTFGRLGNFINGELWGKVSSSPLGMIFPGAGRFSAKEQWVQDIAAKAGISISSMNDMVNLPRHPSQLYEAVFEGVVLWLLLWVFVRKRKAFSGFAIGAYLVGYGLARFVIEYFREPDAGMGYVINLGDPRSPTWIFSTPFDFSMGQILSSLMVLAGALWLVFGARLTAKFARSQVPASRTGASAAKAGAGGTSGRNRSGRKTSGRKGKKTR